LFRVIQKSDKISDILVKVLMNFYYNSNRIVLYLFFIDLDLSTKIYKQNIDDVFKDPSCRHRALIYIFFLHLFNLGKQTFI